MRNAETNLNIRQAVTGEPDEWKHSRPVRREAERKVLTLVSNSLAAYPTYRASQRGNSRAVHKLQKLLMKSEAARMLAVRRVTQENRGKKTAGVDGVKAVSPARRIPLARAIHPRHWKRHKARPVRRVWIPKREAERRPRHPHDGRSGAAGAGHDGAGTQREARFEPNSYGFRPGR